MKAINQVSADQIKNLRENGVLGENEIAYVNGDLVLAEHVLTGDKRVVGKIGILSESNRRVLKG